MDKLKFFKSNRYENAVITTFGSTTKEEKQRFQYGESIEETARKLRELADALHPKSENSFWICSNCRMILGPIIDDDTSCICKDYYDHEWVLVENNPTNEDGTRV